MSNFYIQALLSVQMNIIGPQVRRIRESKKMTQEKLAEECRALGWNLSRGTLAKIEVQVRQVTDKEILLLAKVLRAEISEFFKNAAE